MEQQWHAGGNRSSQKWKHGQAIEMKDKFLTADNLTALARWILGILFIYTGLVKAINPVDFLKLIRQYELVENYMLLNLVAVIIPWLEVFCGFLLLAGIAVRGTALTLLGMLAPFTVIVLKRALAIQSLQSIAFCAVKFDCGCGMGEVFICQKLTENSLMIFMLFMLLIGYGKKYCWRHSI
jgi:uncharacterized membrane protein YphA (DoxX/SURF4 family)